MFECFKIVEFFSFSTVMETLSLHQLLVIIRQNTPIVAQISAIRVNLEGIGLLSLYKTKGPAITTTVIKIVPPRLLYLDKSVL